MHGLVFVFFYMPGIEIVDPEVFDSKDGKVVVLFTDDLLPIGFIAKNVLGFGDLYGNLEEKTN